MAVEGTTDTGPEVLVELRRGRGPLRAQLEDALRDAVRRGRLAPGARLPSSRALARDLSVSRRLVVDAYEQLLAEGYVVARRGAGTFVAAGAPGGAGAPASGRGGRTPALRLLPWRPRPGGVPAGGVAARDPRGAARRARCGLALPGRPRRPAPAPRAGRPPAPRARRGGRPRAHRRRGRRHAGARAAGPRPGRVGRAGDRRRGPEPPAPPAGAGRHGARGRARPRRRRRTRRGGAGADRGRGGRRHARSPVPARHGAQRAAPDGAPGLGAGRRPDRRGRLRRRVPLRPRAGRRAAGARARSRRLPGHGVEGPRARAAAGLARVARRAWSSPSPATRRSTTPASRSSSSSSSRDCSTRPPTTATCASRAGATGSAATRSRPRWPSIFRARAWRAWPPGCTRSCACRARSRPTP